jgi:DNA-binding IscR family transcriptional regulator
MWMRFQSRETIRELLQEVICSDRDKLVFELTDGLRSATEIAKAAKVSQPRISQIWNSWKPLGIILEVPGAKGKYKHICSLNELGIKTVLPLTEGETSSG